GLAVTARRLGIPVYFTEGTHRAWMRWLTPRRQMSYAQWLEQCRKQAAERQAELEASAIEVEPDEAEGELDLEAAAAEPVPAMDGAEAIPSRKQDPTWLPAV